MRDIEKRALSEGLIKPEAIFECKEQCFVGVHANSHDRPKVVINVRLVTEPLMDRDFEGDLVFDVEEGPYMTLLLNIVDESLTLTKFKTLRSDC